ncbi:MAG: acyltransferase [Clostridia bacterium]|nr:acyltransferase [Clostridia bacterium]
MSAEQKTVMRKDEIRLQNVLFCIFVVLIHLFPQEILVHEAAFLIQRPLFCAIFGFMFLSGLKGGLAPYRGEWLSYYCRRFTKILIPYVISVVIYWLLHGLLGKHNFDIIRLLWAFVTGKEEAHFYFVIALSELYLLFPLLRRLTDRVSGGIVLPIAFVLTLLSSVFLCGYDFYPGLFLRYLFCYLLGLYAGKHYEAFCKKLKNWTFFLFILYALFLGAELAAANLWHFYDIAFPLQQEITLFYMPIAVLSFYRISLFLVEHTRLSHQAWVLAIDRNSYYIYLIHILIITLAGWLLSFGGIKESVLYATLRTVITLCALSVWLALDAVILRLKKR